MITKAWLMVGVGLCLASVMLEAAPAGETQGEMNHQASVDFETADTRLNEVYKQVLALLNGTEKQKLIAAQRKWIAFRDAEAEYQAAKVEGGSMRPTIYYGNATDLTEQRIKSGLGISQGGEVELGEALDLAPR